MKCIAVILSCCVFFTACNTFDVYEQTKAFPNHEWKSNEGLTFTFKITDTVSRYNVYLVLRHEDPYHYRNIWIDIQEKDPDTTYTIRREFTLADGTHWLGSGIDDIFEHRLLFNSDPRPFKKGNYTFTLHHVMREDPLQFMMNAGVRVEKIKP